MVLSFYIKVFQLSIVFKPNIHNHRIVITPFGLFTAITDRFEIIRMEQVIDPQHSQQTPVGKDGSMPLFLKGIDKIEVGQCAATIKAIKKVEPYHGYGIYYKDEVVVRKEGKTAGK